MHTQRRRLLLPILLATGAATVLAGCSSSPAAAPTDSGDGAVRVVASTNVYGQIAEEIGGDAVDVTSIVTSSTQDPHAYEASAHDQLIVSEADIIIQNGGGYDSFVDSLIESSGSTASVITVAEFSHDWPGAAHEHEEGDGDAEETEGAEAHADDHDGHDHVEGFNEHVWYDPHTMEHFAEDLAAQLSELRPESADAIDANLDAFLDGIAGLENDLAAIAADHAGEKVFATEPVPLYLVAAAELVNVSPEGFTEAVEEEQDVPPVVMLESLDLLRAGDVRIVLVNTQTGGAETTQIEDEAESLGIPVAAFSETLPEGDTYLEWMTANIAQIASALA